MKTKRTILFLTLACMFSALPAQITNIGMDKEQFNEDSLVHDFDNRPLFGIYEDNYFVLGTALTH